MLELFGRMLATGIALLAVLGLAASACVHVASLAGASLLGEGSGRMMFLHIGVFVVFLPTVLADWIDRLRSGRRFSLGGTTMKIAAGVLFAYALVNFFWCMHLIQAREAMAAADSVPAAAGVDALTARVFSGHWMLFYFVAFAFNLRRAMPGLPT